MSLISSQFNTPIGVMDIVHDEQYIYRAMFNHIDAPGQLRPGLDLSHNVVQISGPKTAFSTRIIDELNAYFKNPQYRFQLLLNPEGTRFQKRVWNSLLVIPSGRTMTYGDLSTKLQSSPRAIGQACKKNPLAIFIPCHRVIGKTHVGGYMGNQEALIFKLALLKHEKSFKPSMERA